MPKIKLTGFIKIPPIVGNDGDIVTVNTDNASLAKTLVEIGSAREVKLPDDDDEDEDEDEGDTKTPAGPQAEKLDPNLIPPEVLAASKVETPAAAPEVPPAPEVAPMNVVEVPAAPAVPATAQATETATATVPTGKLKRDSAVSELGALGIHGRYIKALTDANAKTIGELADHPDAIVNVPGISPAAAEQIKKVIADNLAV